MNMTDDYIKIFEFNSCLGKDHIIEMMLGYRAHVNIKYLEEDELACRTMKNLPHVDEDRWEILCNMDKDELYEEFLRCGHAWKSENMIKECEIGASTNYRRSPDCEMIRISADGKNYYKEFKNMSGWISVKDEMPPVGRVVLLHQTYPPNTAFNCRADPLIRNFNKVGGLRYDGKFISSEDQYLEEGLKYISHWMQLPNPPISGN